jgi:LmbE family N-acetylglucosaminyl deacetylase
MTTLGIWAHPDDEVFVSGGLMRQGALRGERVVCIHMTRGEGGLYYRRKCAPHYLARVRERELDASLARLGVHEQRFFDYPDGALSDVRGDEPIARLHAALVDLQPDVIVTFGPDGFTGHPDHKALSSWVTEALELWNNPEPHLYHAVVTADWKHSFAPALDEFDFFWPGHPIANTDSADLSLRCDDEVVLAKTEALSAHASQMRPLFDSYGDHFMRAMASVEHFQLVDRTTQGRAALRSLAGSRRSDANRPLNSPCLSHLISRRGGRRDDGVGSAINVT